jgi:hypothetical protein
MEEEKICPYRVTNPVAESQLNPFSKLLWDDPKWNTATST